MKVGCPSCQWTGKATERSTDRWVLCPKCKNKMLVRGTGMIVVPEKPPQIIKIPSARKPERETLPPHLQNLAEDFRRQIDQKRHHQQDSDPEIELEIEDEPIPHDPGLIYQGDRIRIYDDGRVLFPRWRNREEARLLHKEIKLAIDEAKLALKVLVEEQRKLEATLTIRNRAMGPSLFRYSRKGVGSFLYLAQLVGKAIASVDSAANRHELESRRATTSKIKFNLEAIEIEVRKYLQLAS